MTSEYDVLLMPTGGHSSETFAYGAIAALRHTGKTLVIYALYDFDRSGLDAASLDEKVTRFGEEYRVPVQFHNLGLNLSQVIEQNPTRPTKRNRVADRRWAYSIAADLDATPPNRLRLMVR